MVRFVWSWIGALALLSALVSAGEAGARNHDDGRAFHRELGSPDPGCTTVHPIRLQPVAESPEELPYVDLIRVCTSEQALTTVLFNDSDVTWKIFADGPADVTQLDDGTLEFDSFAELSSNFYESALLFPYSGVVVGAPPDTLNWYIHGGLSAGWIVHHRMVESAWDFGAEAAIDILSGQRAGRRALLTCGWSAVELAGTDLERLSGPDPFEGLLEGLGAASAFTSCGGALLRARDDLAARLGVEASEWTTDVVRMSDDISFMNRSSQLLDDFLRLIRIGIHT